MPEGSQRAAAQADGTDDPTRPHRALDPLGCVAADGGGLGESFRPAIGWMRAPGPVPDSTAVAGSLPGRVRYGAGTT